MFANAYIASNLDKPNRKALKYIQRLTVALLMGEQVMPDSAFVPYLSMQRQWRIVTKLFTYE
jgi:glucose-6-phosphate dehydrogenase assembly protein OpcA